MVKHNPSISVHPHLPQISTGNTVLGFPINKAVDGCTCTEQPIVLAHSVYIFWDWTVGFMTAAAGRVSDAVNSCCCYENV